MRDFNIGSDARLGTQGGSPVFQSLRRETLSFRNLLLVGRDSVEPRKIQAAPRSVALPTMCRVSTVFAALFEMQKQEPGRENGGSDIEPAGVIPNNVRVLHRARRARSLGNQA